MTTGKSRAELYRQVAARMERALREGFWLEAISLQESMVADRLESLLEAVHGERNHRSLGALISAARRLEGLEPGDVEFLGRLDAWRVQRNEALHMMVKFSDAHSAPWAERLAYCRAAALDGRPLRLEADRWVRARRRAL